jgi:flagellar basal-body rod protein FlgF
MDRLLYVAMTGAAHVDRGQTVHANNLANVSTTGFRADLAQARAVQVFGDGYSGRFYALAENPASNLAQGAMVDTARDLDVAIEGDGFFTVQTADGHEAYTRAGDFAVDSLGNLRTGTGQQVVGDGGPITLPPYQRLQIGADGSITIQPEGQGAEGLVQIDRLRLVKPAPGDVTKGVDGLFHSRANAPIAVSPDVHVVSGFLESSNVNAIHEMTSILELARQFELEVRMMQAAQHNDEAATSLVHVE